MVRSRPMIDQFVGVVFALGSAKIPRTRLWAGMECAGIAELNELALRCAGAEGEHRENGKRDREGNEYFHLILEVPRD